jgi:hypothetical protein
MEKLCSLRCAIGSVEECARGWCAFWEHGGAVVEPGCMIERLGVDVNNVDLAYYLLDLRHALERVRDEEAAALARRDRAALVPPDLSGS